MISWLYQQITSSIHVDDLLVIIQGSHQEMVMIFMTSYSVHVKLQGNMNLGITADRSRQNAQ